MRKMMVANSPFKVESYGKDSYSMGSEGKGRIKEK